MKQIDNLQIEMNKLIKDSIIEDVYNLIESGYDIPEDIQDLMILFNINKEDIQELCEDI